MAPSWHGRGGRSARSRGDSDGPGPGGCLPPPPRPGPGKGRAREGAGWHSSPGPAGRPFSREKSRALPRRGRGQGLGCGRAGHWQSSGDSDGGKPLRTAFLWGKDSEHTVTAGLPVCTGNQRRVLYSASQSLPPVTRTWWSQLGVTESLPRPSLNFIRPLQVKFKLFDSQREFAWQHTKESFCFIRWA
jgi:hypothetical protein